MYEVHVLMYSGLHQHCAQDSLCNTCASIFLDLTLSFEPRILSTARETER